MKYILFLFLWWAVCARTDDIGSSMPCNVCDLIRLLRSPGLRSVHTSINKNKSLFCFLRQLRSGVGVTAALPLLEWFVVYSIGHQIAPDPRRAFRSSTEFHFFLNLFSVFFFARSFRSSTLRLSVSALSCIVNIFEMFNNFFLKGIKNEREKKWSVQRRGEHKHKCSANDIVGDDEDGSINELRVTPRIHIAQLESVENITWV